MVSPSTSSRKLPSEYTKGQLEELSATVKAGIEIKDRSYRFKTYQKCFVAKDLVKHLLQNNLAQDDKEAVELGQRLKSEGYIIHVTRDHDFKNEGLYFRFMEDDRDRGHAADANETWHSMLKDHKDKELEGAELKRAIEDKSDFAAKNPQHLPEMLFNEENCDLFDHVRPMHWVDPKAEDKYDIVVIGGGAGGLVTAAGSAGVGAKVALIERTFTGGDCLVTGCVPSKAFIHAANVAATCRQAAELGIETGEVKVNFKKVMEHVRKVRAEIAENDSVHRFSRALGCDVYLGDAKFASKNEVVVNGQKLKFTKCAVATGALPIVPQAEGLENIKYYTSENIWNLDACPRTMVFVGSGPIGCELGQSFQRLGAQVTMLERNNKFLPREDQDASHLVEEQMRKDGVDIRTYASVQKFEKLEDTWEGNARTRVYFHVAGETEPMHVDADAVVFAIGRRANIKGLNLEVAGVEYDDRGLKVNNHLQTTNSDVYGVGECCTSMQFTHNSDICAKYVIRNALFFGSQDYTKIILPWCTYTSPEVAHVGKYPHQMDAEGTQYDTYTKFYDKLDRALCDGQKGLMKIHTKKGSDEIIGATIVGGAAGDMISQVTSAMFNQLGLSKLGAMIFPYPTYAESFMHLSGRINSKKLTPGTKSVLRGVLGIKR